MPQEGTRLVQALDACVAVLRDGGAVTQAIEAIHRLPADDDRMFLEALVRLRFGDEEGAGHLLQAAGAEDKPWALWLNAMRKMRSGALDEGRLMMNRAWTHGLPKQLMLDSYAALFEPLLSAGDAARLRVEAAKAGADRLDYPALLIQRGAFDAARSALDSINGESSNAPRAQLMRIQIAMFTGRSDEAQALLSAHEDELDAAGYQLAVDLLKNQLELNKREYQGVLSRTQPDDFSSFLEGEQRIRALMMAQRTDEAADLARRLWSDPRTGFQEKLAIARLMIRAGKADVARECLKAAGEPDAEPPAEPWLHWQLLMAEADAAANENPAARRRLEALCQACGRVCAGDQANLPSYLLWMHCLRELKQTAKADEIMTFVKLRYPGALPDGFEP